MAPLLPASLSRAPSDLARALRGYKDGPHCSKAGFGAVVAALLARFLFDHTACVETVLEGPWDFVTCVPSSRGRPPPHPLEASFNRVRWLADQHRPALTQGPGRLGHGRPIARAFTARPWVSGARILLLDDTFTSGASVHSAAAALRSAGARRVAVVVLARAVDPSFGRHGSRWWSEATAVPFDFGRCAWHQDAPALGARPQASAA